MLIVQPLRGLEQVGFGDWASKALAPFVDIQPGDRSLILRRYIKVGRTSSTELSSDLHTWAWDTFHVCHTLTHNEHFFSNILNKDLN